MTCNDNRQPPQPKTDCDKAVYAPIIIVMDLRASRVTGRSATRVSSTLPYFSMANLTKRRICNRIPSIRGYNSSQKSDHDCWVPFCPLCVLFYFSFWCLHVCAYAIESKVHCGSALGPGASGLPYYCTPPVCVPAVLGGLALWWHNKIKPKNERLRDAAMHTLMW